MFRRNEPKQPNESIWLSYRQMNSYRILCKIGDIQMNTGTISLIVGYILAINMISIILMWIKAKTEYIKIPDNIMNTIFVILSLAGGFIGVLRGTEMLGYQTDNKLFKRYIPVMIFFEVCIVLWIIGTNDTFPQKGII